MISNLLRIPYYTCAAICLMLFFLTPAVVLAAPSGAISQSYATTTTNITQGTLLSLVSTSSSSVEPADNTSTARLTGIAASKPLVELSSNSSNKNSIQVVVSGSTL